MSDTYSSINEILSTDVYDIATKLLSTFKNHLYEQTYISKQIDTTASF